MSTRLTILLAVLMVSGGYLWYVLAHKPIRCVTPMPYEVTDVDSRFDITKEEFGQAVAQAADVWNKALKRNVFVPSDNPEIKIYAVYGKSQSAYDLNAQLESDIAEAKEKMRTTKSTAEYYEAKRIVDKDLALLGNIITQGDTDGRYQDHTIFIYGFDSKVALVRVLEHEFGHALGLDHVDHAGAVMNPVNRGDNLELTLADLAELEQTCEAK